MDTANQEPIVSTQYLTFSSAGTDYAVPIMRMKEIVPYERSTRVPMTPREIRGLINLRGRAIPVLDLAARFGQLPTEVSNRTCVLIVDLDGESDNGDMGILADSVSRVIDIGPDEFEGTPDFGTNVAPELILGMAKQDERFIPILDVAKLLDLSDSISIEGPAGATDEEASAEPPSSEDTLEFPAAPAD